MKRILFLGTIALLVLGLFISAISLAAEDPKQYYAKYLSAADVEKATGLKGITKSVSTRLKDLTRRLRRRIIGLP